MVWESHHRAFKGSWTQGPFSLLLSVLGSGVPASWEGTEVAGAYLGCIQVRGVLHHPGVIAIVPQLDDRVKKVGKHLQEGRGSCFLWKGPRKMFLGSTTLIGSSFALFILSAKPKVMPSFSEILSATMQETDVRLH